MKTKLSVTLLVFLATLLAACQAPQAELAPDAALTTPQAQVIPVIYQTVSQNADDLQTTLMSIYQQANPAVVYILTQNGSGSGFVYDDQGHIVTNRHVVADGGALEIVFASGERLRGEVIGEDIDSDLAVVTVGELPEGVEPLALAEAGDIQVGQFAIAIGNPFGEKGSMSLGIVSGIGRSLPSQRTLNGVQGTYSLPKVIQTDAPINPGNSGGPLLNLSGQVIGINSALVSTSGSNSGVGFAIPVEAVRLIVPNLIKDGSHAYAYMGVSFDDEISLSEQELYGVSTTRGVYIVRVSEGSPAAAAGLRAANPQSGKGGDLITAVDGQPLSDFSGMNAYLVFHTRPGQTIELSVLRDGKEIKLPLTLGERPN